MQREMASRVNGSEVRHETIFNSISAGLGIVRMWE